MIIFKQLLTLFSSKTKHVNAVQLYYVRWESRYGAYSHSVKPEVEAFPTLDEANTFADALRSAFKVIRHTSGNKVRVD